MPFIPIPDVAQVRIEGRMDGQMTLNDLYFEIAGGGITPTNIAALANAVDGWASASLAPQLSEDWSYVRTQAFDQTSNIGPVGSQATPAVGGVASEAAPNNVACCVSLRTAQRGRSGRGRNFVPGVPNAAITLNTISPTFITNILTIYNALVGAGTFLAGWQLVVASRYTAGAPRVTGIAIPVTEVIMVTNTVRSMRSREVGHGA